MALMSRTVLALAAGCFASPTFGSDNLVFLKLSGHRFVPAEIHVEANVPTTVSITNEDDQSDIFVSNSLKAKKVIAAHTTGTMRWRPLAPGRYPFIAEFQADTVQGIVVAE
ncbi:MAG: cupredoxin domain-containing protein [Proteobacteria bacterium]|nr:cupredoxin domain-containing protein [Pseudomonadota bacterium]